MVKCEVINGLITVGGAKHYAICNGELVATGAIISEVFEKTKDLPPCTILGFPPSVKLMEVMKGDKNV